MVLAVISQKFLPCGCESLGRHAFPKFLEIEKAKKKILCGAGSGSCLRFGMCEQHPGNKTRSRLCFINNKSSWLVQHMPIFFCLLNSPFPYKSEGFLICLGPLARWSEVTVTLLQGLGFPASSTGLGC